MKLFFCCIFSFVLVTLSVNVEAQDIPVTEDVDSVEQAAIADSVARAQFVVDSTARANHIADSLSLVGSKVNIGVILDYGKILTLPFDFEQKFEGGISITLKRKWTLGVKAGKASLNPLRPYRNGDAVAEGYYYGGFIQYNINLDLYNTLYVGGGYNQGEFDDEITYTIGGNFYEEEFYRQKRTGLQASWASIRIGSEQKLNKRIVLGGLIDLRIKTSFNQPEGIEAYVIPGYGKSGDGNSPALNLYLKFRL